MNDLSKKEIAVLGKMTDAAASLDLAHSAVRLKRISLACGTLQMLERQLKRFLVKAFGSLHVLHIDFESADGIAF